LNPITGQIILFIRSHPGAALQMHFHPGTIVVYTVQGAWTYDEGWVSEAGDARKKERRFSGEMSKR